MPFRVAYIRQSQLYVSAGDGNEQEVSSQFAMDAEKRASKSRAVDGWKDGASAWNNGWMQPQFSQFQQAGVARRMVSFTNVARGCSDTIAYTLDLGGAGGLFRYDLGKKLECRLMHRNGFAPQGLAARPTDGLLAFSVRGEDGSMNIAIGERDGVFHRTLTTGDSQDAAPTWWNDGRQDWVYFHSSGVYRNQQGIALGLSPATICRIGLESGEVEPILESESTDFVQPRLDSAGALYCIRRPYSKLGPKPEDPMTLLQDVLFFPFRLARALFYFLNFISIMFARKPLTNRTLDPERPEDLAQLQVWGKAIDVQKGLKQSQREKRLRLVPDGWELVRQKSDKSLEVLARNVMCFDLGPNGEIVYSDGGGIYELTPTGERKVTSTTHVVQLAVLGTPPTSS